METRDELLAEYLPASDGTPAQPVRRIVESFAARHGRLHLRDDLVQTAYLAICQSLDRALETENPRGYLTTAMRSRMIDFVREDSVIHRPYNAKLPAMNQREEAWTNSTPDRPHLNGELAELVEGLNHGDAELARLLADGWKVQEIATRENAPAITIYARRRRLRMQLRWILADRQAQRRGGRE